jgi:hypothetical protein
MVRNRLYCFLHIALAFSNLLAVLLMICVHSFWNAHATKSDASCNAIHYLGHPERVHFTDNTPVHENSLRDSIGSHRLNLLQIDCGGGGGY